METSEALARSVAGTGRPADDRTRIREMYLRLYGRAPSSPDSDRFLALLSRLRQTEAGGTAKRAWALACQTALAANEFLYVR